MGVEQKINQQLNKYPAIKRTVKSVYQHTMHAIGLKWIMRVMSFGYHRMIQSMSIFLATTISLLGMPLGGMRFA